MSIEERIKDLTKDYVVVRSKGAGVFAGYLQEKDLAKGTCVLTNARRVWQWQGAASLSQIALDGSTKPDQCKFPEAVPIVELAEVVEILPTTKKAQHCIEKLIPVWKST